MYEEYLTRALSNSIMARQAMTSFKEYNSKDLKNGAAYHSQQAMELLIKYIIYNDEKYNKGSEEIEQIRIHDIDRLIKEYIKPYDISVPELIEKKAKIYSTWEAESRYDLHFSVRADSIYKAITTVEEWLVNIKPSYKKKIDIVRERYPYNNR